MGILRTLALGAIGYGVYSALRQRDRTSSVGQTKPEPLQRWEAEGGNVPVANPGLQDPLASQAGRSARSAADF